MSDHRERACTGLAATVAVIEQVCDANEALIRQRIAEGRPLPKMYESGLRYDLSPDIGETVLNAEALLMRGFADVDELVAWRVAELRVGGEPAQVGAFQRIVPEGKHVHGYAFVCVIRGDGRLEQPERAEHWGRQESALSPRSFSGLSEKVAELLHAERPPSRCRIVVEGDHWGCLSAGCGAEGAVENGRLVHVEEPRKSRVTTIAVADATGPHPYVEGEVCLFDKIRAQAVAGAQASWWTDPVKEAPGIVAHTYEERLENPSDGLVSLLLHPQRITFCGQQVDVACDRRCDKAWGRDIRPRKQLSENPDDYVCVSDSDLGRAPFPSNSTEGDQGKPSGTSHHGPLNKWCVRACERCVMVDAGRTITLPDLARPLPNIRKQ